MKLFLPICLVGFLLTLENEAFAIIHKNTDNLFPIHRVALKQAPQMKKPMLLQRYIVKLTAINQDSIKKKNDWSQKSQGDKLAQISYNCFLLIGILALSSLLFLALQVEILGLILLGTIQPLLIGGIILYILAITHKEITPEGKKRQRLVYVLLVSFSYSVSSFFSFSLN